jgi:PTH1 family peptidyl-tRNA hydrolase
MKSIIAHLGTENFPRVRAGVGEKPEKYDLADWVLGHFDKADRDAVQTGIDNAARAVTVMISEGADVAMNIFNGI